jgi:hypothetical protein
MGRFQQKNGVFGATGESFSRNRCTDHRVSTCVFGVPQSNPGRIKPGIVFLSVDNGKHGASWALQVDTDTARDFRHY